MTAMPGLLCSSPKGGVIEQFLRFTLNCDRGVQRQFRQHKPVEHFVAKFGIRQPPLYVLDRIVGVRSRFAILIAGAVEVDQHQLSLGFRLMHCVRVIVEPNEILADLNSLLAETWLICAAGRRARRPSSPSRLMN